MFHAEGRAGFNLGYIEGLADGRAGVKGNSATASGRASLRFSPPDLGWPARLDPDNYRWSSDKGIHYNPEYGVMREVARDIGRQKAQVSKAVVPYVRNLSNRRVYNNHSTVRSVGGGPAMYGFRRGYRRRVYRRRAVYRRRRFY